MNRDEIATEMLEVARRGEVFALADSRMSTTEVLDLKKEKHRVMHKFSRLTAEHAPGGIPEEAVEDCGRQIARRREALRWDLIKTCKNRLYAGDARRSSVSKIISVPLLEEAASDLMRKRREIKSSSLQSDSRSQSRMCEQDIFVFVHDYQRHDVFDLPNFCGKPKYEGKHKHDCTIGSLGKFTFFASDAIQAYFGAGAELDGQKLESQDDTNIDVYPVVVVVRDAWKGLPLPAAEHFEMVHIPYDLRDKSDPFGETGILGASFDDGATVTNPDLITIIETAVTYYGPDRETS